MRSALLKDRDGTISVFLSLVLLLIVCLLLTLVEGARVSTTKVYAERSLLAATDSVLAEYYGPLWEEYHLFGYYSQESEEGTEKEQLSDMLKDYMMYSFEPDIVLQEMEGNYMNLIHARPDSVTILKDIALTDYDGKLFLKEAVEYAKYKEVGDGVLKLLDKFALLETPKKVSYLMEEKLKVQDELVELDQGILRLMELLDGLNTSPKGIEIREDGSLSTVASFIKKICYGEATKEKVEINQEQLFQAQRHRYVDPSRFFNQIDSNFTQIDETLKQITLLEGSLALVEQKISDTQKELRDLKAPSNKTDEAKAKIKKLQEDIGELSAAMNEITVQLSEYQGNINFYATLIRFNQTAIINLSEEINPLIDEAVTQIDSINQKAEEAKPLLDGFERLLTAEKEYLDSDIYQSFEEELDKLKNYVEAEQRYNFPNMRLILVNNRETLHRVQGLLDTAGEALEQNLYASAQKDYSMAARILSGYQIKGLELDYNSIVLNHSAQENPLNKVNNLLQSGLLELVVNSEQISKARMNTNVSLPSKTAALSWKDKDALAELGTYFQKVIGDRTGTGSILSNFGSRMDISNILKQGINDILEKVLFSGYLQEHFGRYQSDTQLTSSQKPSILTYELEYLIAGKDSDHENLASVVTNIILLRTILDFVSILGDKAKCEEAKFVATALVGFSGLTILISITQVLILIVWAFAEALLDTSALMSGLKIPLIKKDIIMEFTDIFLISREFLKQKAKGIESTGGIALSYPEYIRIYLITERQRDLIYRSMDLVQENIKLRYQVEDFQIERCLYGFDAAAELNIEKKFLSLSFVKDYLRSSSTGFQISIKASNSY